MAFKVMADNTGETISASQDGAMYDLFGNRESYVIAGISSQLGVTYTSSSLTVTLGTGMGVIRGRHVTNTSTATTTLPANSTGYLVLRYDHGHITFAGVTTVQDGNINNSESVVADLVLGQYTTSSSGVSQYTDMRKIKTNMIQDVQHIYFETTQPVNPQNYSANDIWIRWYVQNDHDCYAFFVNYNQAQWVKMFAVDSWSKTLI